VGRSRSESTNRRRVTCGGRMRESVRIQSVTSVPPLVLLRERMRNLKMMRVLTGVGGMLLLQQVVRKVILLVQN
jgi:hypothetical protein